MRYGRSVPISLSLCHLSLMPVDTLARLVPSARRQGVPRCLETTLHLTPPPAQSLLPPTTTTVLRPALPPTIVAVTSSACNSVALPP